MKLFKNVDVKDLESIMTRGLLSANAANNHNWDGSNRADNSLDLVYLFSPKTSANSMTHYGTALVEVETAAEPHKIREMDVNRGLYDEFTAPTVKPDEIKAVYLPEILRTLCEAELTPEIIDRVTWVEISAQDWRDEDLDYRDMTTESLREWAASVQYIDTGYFYLRGLHADKSVWDVKNVTYKI